MRSARFHRGSWFTYTRLELLEVFRRPPRQLGVGRNYVEKSSGPSSSILRLPGHQRFKPLPAYRKSGEARGANYPQQAPAPFNAKGSYRNFLSTFARSLDAIAPIVRVYLFALNVPSLLLFHRRLDGHLGTARAQVPAKTACESGQTQSAQRYMRLKNCELRFQWRGSEWPCWIRFRLLSRATALSERCSMIDKASKRARTPPRSPIRARGQKCLLGDDAREESASDTCQPPVTSKSHGRADKLIDLVSSSSIDGTVRVFTESLVLAWTFFPTGALTDSTQSEHRRPP